MDAEFTFDFWRFIQRVTRVDIDHIVEKSVEEVKNSGYTPIHDLRHSFGTRLSQRGKDSFTTKVLMGQKTLMMTSRYVHHSVESLPSAVEGLCDSVTILSQLDGAKTVSL